MQEHILACLSSSPSNPKIIRTAARMAEAFGGIFTALYVQTPDDTKRSGADKQRLEAHMKLAEDAGADGTLLVTPYYNKTSQAGLIRHYSYLADRAEKPILLYDVPARTGMTIAPETLAELSRHPRIAGVKAAGTDLDAISRAMRLCPADFSFYSGNDSLTLPLMALGAKGVISVCANLIPEAMSELTRLCLAGDYRDAASLHYEYLELMEALFLDVNPIPVKAAMAAAGLCSGELRLPLTELSGEKRAKLISLMQRYGLAA